MNHKPSILAIIPARGGSKGIPRKNIRLVAGKPLIEYTFNVAKNAKSLTKIIVSTDDNDVLELAEKNKIEALKRPENLATDTSNVVDTVFHVLEYLKSKKETYDILVLLQPTAPLRLPEDIDFAVELMQSNDTDGVISVVEVGDHHPARMYSIDADNLVSFIEKGETTRRQDLKDLFIRNGAIYIIKTQALYEEKSLMPKNKIPYLMNKRWAINIDEELDLDVLEIVIKKWIEKYGDFNY